MKRINCILILFLIFSSTILKAQTQFANEAQLKSFPSTTTYVVMEDTQLSLFNNSITDLMKKLWTITPFKVISAQEFNKLNKSPQNSFIYISLAQLTKYGKADNDNIYNILNLILGDKSGDINKMPDLGSIPLSYEEDNEGYVYKLGGLLLAMQYYVNYKIQNPKDKIEDLAKKYVAEVKSKELWLLATDMASEVNTLDKIKKVYPYQVKLVSEEEIEKAIDLKNPNVAILHKIGPAETSKNGGQCWKFIISLKEGKPLYFDQHKIDNSHPNGLLIEDFKNFAK